MESIPDSGLYIPNKFAFAALQSLEGVMGKNGLNAVLNLANLGSLIDNFPEDNLKKEYDFSHLSVLNLALEEMYGPRGGRGLALRAGRSTFSDVLSKYGAFAGIGDVAFKILPLSTKIKVGLQILAKNFSLLSDQKSTLNERENEFIFTIHQCSICWGRTGEANSVCFMFTGLLQEGLKWFSGGEEFRINESKCVAKGDDVCEFVIRKQPIKSNQSSLARA
ncbi:MAG: 4-vinyl reductase [Chloroflexota bacterium]